MKPIPKIDCRNVFAFAGSFGDRPHARYPYVYVELVPNQ